MLVEGRANSGGGGGGLVRTTLWTNSSPTSDYPSSTSTVTVDATLSDDMDNYQYLEFIFRKSTSNSDTFSMIIPVSEFKLTEGGTGIGKYKYVASVTTTYVSNMRNFYYGGDTTVKFERFITYRSNSSNVVTNSYAVPIYIKGINVSSS